MQEPQYRFRHILRSGRILKPDERLPVTPESQAAFAEAAKILFRAREAKAKAASQS